jgi:hypothetical protein
MEPREHSSNIQVHHYLFTLDVIPLQSNRTLSSLPQINCFIGTGVDFRKSTQVMFPKKGGRFGFWGASARRTGITGQPRLMNSLRNASNSMCCQGPRLDLPTKTAADLIWPICCCSNLCQGRPGCSSHSSNQGRIPRLFSCSPICLTSGLSSLLWQRKTSKCTEDCLTFKMRFCCKNLSSAK